MSSNNWWAQKLGGQAAPATPQFQQPTPPQQYQSPYPPLNNPAAMQPMTQAVPNQLDGRLIPQSSRTDTSCPGCRGNNYATVGSIATQNGSVEAKRCYDCGYPLVQAGSGMSGIRGAGSSQGPTKAAVQVPTGGWNPGVIIGHI